MAYRDKTYTLREESTESGERYFISFKDGQGEHHELEVSEGRYSTLRLREMESPKSASTSINSTSCALPLMRRSRGRQAMSGTLRVTRKTAISGARTA